LLKTISGIHSRNAQEQTGQQVENRNTGHSLLLKKQKVETEGGKSTESPAKSCDEQQVPRRIFMTGNLRMGPKKSRQKASQNIDKKSSERKVGMGKQMANQEKTGHTAESAACENKKKLRQVHFLNNQKRRERIRLMSKLVANGK
jgi:hypothetical protein